jgi:cytochrome c oxidase cbb3-type subunit 4
MDWIVLRTLGTVVSFSVFVGIVVWAYARNQSERFNQDALIPFQEDEVSVPLMTDLENRSGAHQ